MSVGATDTMIRVLLLVLDLGGTFVFAISGATAAVKHRLDLFGVLALSFAAGNAGGIVRDVLLGAVPPAAIADWKYLGMSVLAGLITFRWHSTTERLRRDVLWWDAVGLAFFAVAGTQKALLHGLNPTMAPLLGMLTAVGGGVLRDVLLTEIPVILRADLYASAALAGAGVVVIATGLQLPPIAGAISGAVVCFALRFAALRYGWHLPTAAARDGTD